MALDVVVPGEQRDLLAEHPAAQGGRGRGADLRGVDDERRCVKSEKDPAFPRGVAVLMGRRALVVTCG